MTKTSGHGIKGLLLTAMIRIALSDEEITLLQAYSKTSPIHLLRQKAQTILLRSRGIKIKDISFTYNVGYRTIERWIKDFSEVRMGSIFSGLVGNENAAKLTRFQKEAVQKVLKEHPSVYGLPKEFWDVPQLKEYIYARFGTIYESDRSYHFLLEFGNLSFKYPDTFDRRRNLQKIQVRMEEIYKELLPLIEDPSWEVFASDEVCIRLEAITRKAWLKRGKRTVIKIARESTKQNYLGFLNQKSFACHVFPIETGNAQETIRATGELIRLYPHKKICIIWDNAKWHKGKQMQEALSHKGPLEKVHLIHLPPYAPDYNPIEKVWNSVKDALANHQDSEFEETKRKFVQLTNNRFFYYQI
jgi:transposase